MDLTKAVKETYKKPLASCTNEEIYICLLEQVKKLAKEKETAVEGTGKRKLYYISAEFLIGKLLSNNLINLGLYDEVKKELAAAGKSLAEIEELEPEPSLGNGGLGRLAACFVDSIATLGLNGDGVGLNYHYGLFRQVFNKKHLQQETPNPWMENESWLTKTETSYQVPFGGFTVTSRLYDLDVTGYNNHSTRLRLFDLESVDESIVKDGIDFDKTEIEKNLTLFLYPDDSDDKGRLLRVYQQYFMVSNAAQLILDECIARGSDLHDLADYAAVQINDTHPALVIPELMRIFMDEAGMNWDEAWDIASHSVAYTNHTVLAEALERWPQQLVESLLPRVWQIVQEIAHRWQAKVENFYHDPAKTEKMTILWGGEVRMANLCIAGCLSVNGVSGLHSEILKKDVFKDACAMEPWKFTNVTNGIDHRRWLSEINPGLDALVRDLTGGDDYLLHPQALKKLDAYGEDASVLQRLDEIKWQNKVDFAAYARKMQGVTLDPNAIFDVQVKRLHEYKRQLLNVLHIITLYQQLQDDPNAVTRPHTFLFGAKAAPGYAVAKRIIHLINSLADDISHDPCCRGKLQVVFLENYRVSLAEHLMPASEVSQQISTAGKEASGTGNMKFMMNGALTVGTLDGANVEMHDVLGNENMFLFGLHADQAAKLRQEGYVPQRYVSHDPQLERCLDALRKGFRDGVSYEDLYQRLINQDEYLLLADYRAYCDAERRMAEAYENREGWNRMSLRNIARSGIFAADRAVAEYADNIWHVPHR